MTIMERTRKRKESIFFLKKKPTPRIPPSGKGGEGGEGEEGVLLGFSREKLWGRGENLLKMNFSVGVSIYSEKVTSYW